MSENHGLYVHVPFCVKKCRYCDFYSTSDLGLKGGVVSALVGEMNLRSLGDHVIDTIYFGGGTPSVLTAREMEIILSRIYDLGRVAPSAEVTMEVNPGTVDDVYLADMYSLGVNRLNIGIQSFQDDKLKFLGRIHSASDAVNTLSGARRAGFENIGMDLMFGIPHETSAAWGMDMNTAFSFLPEHLSCYMLTYEQNTPLYRALETGGVIPLGEQDVADLFILTSNRAGQHGYDHYEVSNFAGNTRYRSRHNQKYWSGIPYKGLGPAAHSFDGVERSWNYSNVRRYIHALDNGRLPVMEKECLTRTQVMMEKVMLGLRTFEGMDIRKFENLSGKRFDKQFQSVLDRVKERKWGDCCGGKFALNLAGMVYLDTVVEWFVAKI